MNDSISAIIVAAFFCLAVVIPVSHIVERAGYSRWWALVALWPGVNLIMLWVFACKRWPRDGETTIVGWAKRR